MIQVMVVDDSASVREVIRQILSRQPDMQVIVAPDPIFALARMQTAWPDVIVLDIEMPRMNGLMFLRKIMDERPTPTVICSSWAERGRQITLDALAAGAVAIISKPTVGVREFFSESESELVHAVRAAAAADLRRLRPGVPDSSLADPDALSGALWTSARLAERVVALGISTGGTQALEHILPQLPPSTVGLAIVQHMPAGFTQSFAERLDRLSKIEVKEAATGDHVLPGRALIAPGGRHLRIKRSGGQYVAEVTETPDSSRHRPSADILFQSVAKSAGPLAMGIIMTGMGDDGARGLLAMRAVGSHTVAQDEESSVVFGMPGAAIKRGAVRQIAALNEIPRLIARYGRT